MGTSIATVLRQLHWAADHCQAVMDREFVSLHLGHVEVDEMWTFVGKKQARLTIEERALCHDMGDMFLWYGSLGVNIPPTTPPRLESGKCLSDANSMLWSLTLTDASLA